MSTYRPFRWGAALVAAALTLMMIPTTVASHQAGASLEVRQEPQADDSCSRFFVELDGIDNAVVTVQIWEHGEASAPDQILHEERVTGEPSEDGFRFQAGPYDRSHTFGLTEALYVRATWENAGGFHSIRSDFFVIQCEGGPGPIPDCPTNVQAVALDDGTVRLTWDPVEGADRYHVFRGPLGIPFAIHGTTEAPTFIDVDVEPGQTYVYTVRTFADGSEAIGCEQVEATAIPFFGAAPLVAMALVGAVGAYAWLGRRQS